MAEVVKCLLLFTFYSWETFMWKLIVMCWIYIRTLIVSCYICLLEYLYWLSVNIKIVSSEFSYIPIHSVLHFIPVLSKEAPLSKVTPFYGNLTCMHQVFFFSITSVSVYFWHDKIPSQGKGHGQLTVMMRGEQERHSPGAALCRGAVTTSDILFACQESH